MAFTVFYQPKLYPLEFPKQIVVTWPGGGAFNFSIQELKTRGNYFPYFEATILPFIELVQLQIEPFGKSSFVLFEAHILDD